MKFKLVEAAESKICCICKKPFDGYGNNPYPVRKTGRCCDECNDTKVLKARIDMLKKSSKKNEVDETLEEGIFSRKPKVDLKQKVFGGKSYTKSCIEYLYAEEFKEECCPKSGQIKWTGTYNDGWVVQWDENVDKAAMMADTWVSKRTSPGPDDKLAYKQLNETDESGNDEVDANCEDCGAVITISVDHDGPAYCANCMKNHLHEALEDYKLTYYLSTATAERRPETIEDVENDWKEEVFAADSDYDACRYVFSIIHDIAEEDVDEYLADYDIKDVKEFVEYCEEKDLGDGSAFVVKLEGPKGVIYDMGQTKDDFIEQVKENDKMLNYYRSVLGIDESLNEASERFMLIGFNHFDPENLIVIHGSKADLESIDDDRVDYSEIILATDKLIWIENNDEYLQVSTTDFNSIDEFRNAVVGEMQRNIDAGNNEFEILGLTSFYIDEDSEGLSAEELTDNFMDWIDKSYVDRDSNSAIQLVKGDELDDHFISYASVEEFMTSDDFDDEVIDESLNEAIDPSKALEVKKNSNADVIFYGYQYKNEKPVEFEPPKELSSDEYDEEIWRIVNSKTKLNPDKPTSNRYGYDRDFIFYALYNRKNESNEKDDIKMNENMSVRAKLKALYPELNFSDKVEEAIELEDDEIELNEDRYEVEGQMSFFDDDIDFDIEEDDEIRRMNTLYKGADFDAHDDEVIEEPSDCEDDECWENDLISEEFDDDAEWWNDTLDDETGDFIYQAAEELGFEDFWFEDNGYEGAHTPTNFGYTKDGINYKAECDYEDTDVHSVTAAVDLLKNLDWRAE